MRVGLGLLRIRWIAPQAGKVLAERRSLDLTLLPCIEVAEHDLPRRQFILAEHECEARILLGGALQALTNFAFEAIFDVVAG